MTSRDPIAESLERQDRFYRENPRAQGEPKASWDERWELLDRQIEGGGASSKKRDEPEIAEKSTDTYQAAPVTCPRCGERLSVAKKRNRGSVHAARMRVLGQHIRAAHPEAAA